MNFTADKAGEIIIILTYILLAGKGKGTRNVISEMNYSNNSKDSEDDCFSF